MLGFENHFRYACIPCNRNAKTFDPPLLKHGLKQGAGGTARQINRQGVKSQFDEHTRDIDAAAAGIGADMFDARFFCQDHTLTLRPDINRGIGCIGDYGVHHHAS